MASRVSEHRIRWANVSRGNGHRSVRVRMCIAERRTRLRFFWPVIDGDWRFDEATAQRDIENDRRLREPLPPVRSIA
jgi:hypothetical protein